MTATDSIDNFEHIQHNIQQTNLFIFLTLNIICLQSKIIP